MMSVARARYMKITPTKVRFVLDMVRGKDVNGALNVLQVTKKKAAGVVLEIVKSALSNAQQKHENLQVDSLIISRAVADEGPFLKRFLPRAMGRATPLKKRMSHITIELDQRVNLSNTKQQKG